MEKYLKKSTDRRLNVHNLRERRKKLRLLQAQKNIVVSEVIPGERKISVIMPVYLKPYYKSASDPERKFIRAVNSFLSQTYKNSELIIVADGCKDAEVIYKKNFFSEPSIQFNLIDKSVLYGGEPRNTGIKKATGDIICYLDYDDIIGENHLKIINDYFDIGKYEWVYYNDYIVTSESFQTKIRDVIAEWGRIGTSTVAHRRNVRVVWGDGYGHDWKMIRDCLIRYSCAKIPMPEYYVCHRPIKGYDY